MKQDHPGYAAFMVEAERVRERYDRALENIEWLTAPNPTWACGTPLSRSEIENLLQVNRNVVDYTERNCTHHVLAKV